MVNASKTQSIFIGSRQLCSRIPEDLIIKLDGTIISPSSHVKNLGLYIYIWTGTCHLSHMSMKSARAIQSELKQDRIKNHEYAT